MEKPSDFRVSDILHQKVERVTDVLHGKLKAQATRKSRGTSYTEKSSEFRAEEEVRDSWDDPCRADARDTITCSLISRLHNLFVASIQGYLAHKKTPTPLGPP